jgi:hypothetical protein
MPMRDRARGLLLAGFVLLIAFYAATYLDSRYLRDWAAEASGVD